MSVTFCLQPLIFNFIYFYIKGCKLKNCSNRCYYAIYITATMQPFLLKPRARYSELLGVTFSRSPFSLLALKFLIWGVLNVKITLNLSL